MYFPEHLWAFSLGCLGGVSMMRQSQGKRCDCHTDGMWREMPGGQHGLSSQRPVDFLVP